MTSNNSWSSSSSALLTCVDNQTSPHYVIFNSVYQCLCWFLCRDKRLSRIFSQKAGGYSSLKQFYFLLKCMFVFLKPTSTCLLLLFRIGIMTKPQMFSPYPYQMSPCVDASLSNSLWILYLIHPFILESHLAPNANIPGHAVSSVLVPSTSRRSHNVFRMPCFGHPYCSGSRLSPSQQTWRRSQDHSLDA